MQSKISESGTATSHKTGDPSRALLSVHNLTAQFRTVDGIIPAVHALDLQVDRAETVGIVGESGCGKTVTALSILGLIPKPPGEVVSGEIVFDSVNLLELQPSELRKIRGNQISMIFQEPMTSLNPVYTVGNQIAEAIQAHSGADKKEARERAVVLLSEVGMPSPERRINEYPFQLSGGMRQRAMIAMAIAANPALLIADEPTTALDVTIQAQILDLLARLKDERDMSMLLITHDLGVVAEVAERVVVMYAGEAVEAAPVDALFSSPLHPYTQGLMGSIPRLETSQRRLKAISGTLGNAATLPRGCKFHPRCPHTMAICREQSPDFFVTAKDHRVRCWLHRNTSIRGADGT